MQRATAHARDTSRARARARALPMLGLALALNCVLSASQGPVRAGTAVDQDIAFTGRNGDLATLRFRVEGARAPVAGGTAYVHIIAVTGESKVAKPCKLWGKIWNGSGPKRTFALDLTPNGSMTQRLELRTTTRDAEFDHEKDIVCD